MITFIVRLFHRLSDWWRGYCAGLAIDFYTEVYDLLENEKVLELDKYIQHHNYSRLQHSINVAFISFCIASFLGWDSRATARAGLLHDFYLYDTHSDMDAEEAKNHLQNHPIVALENARSICTLSKKEENIIRRHMWLVTLVPPRYKEGYIVSFVDKFCAVAEFFAGLRSEQKEIRTVFVSAA